MTTALVATALIVIFVTALFLASIWVASYMDKIQDKREAKQDAEIRESIAAIRKLRSGRYTW